MHVTGALRTTLLGLALATAVCSAAGRSLCVAQESPATPLSGTQSTQPASQPAKPSLPPPVTGGMTSYEGLTVQTINFPDLPSATAQRLMVDLIPQKTGAPLLRDNVRQSIQALHSTGRFADIQVDAERTGNGQVVLSFRTQPNFFVGQIFVEGAPNPPAANQVVNASKLQLGELFSREKLERARQASSS